MACVRKRRNKWVVDFRDHEGKRRWESFDTRKDADEALAKRVGQLRKGTYKAPSEMPTFGELARTWMDVRWQDRRHSSCVVWESQLELHLLPVFGKFKLNAITVRSVEVFRDEKAASGLGPVMVNKLLQTATSVLEVAVKHGYIERNPAKLADRYKGRGGEQRSAGDRGIRESEVLSPDQVAKLIEAAEPGLFRAFLMTAALTGARSGELLSLRWDEDVDLETRTITIRRSLSWTKARSERGQAPLARFTQPKTPAALRTIPMAPQLVSELRRWRLACPKGPEGLVFPKLNGGPQHRAHITLKGFKPALERAGLPDVRLHGLRHSFASTLILNGAPVTQVAHLLGHENPSVTLDVYSHWFKRLESAGAIDNIANLMLPAAVAR